MSTTSKTATGAANNSNVTRVSFDLRLMVTLLTNDCDHPVAASDDEKREKRTTATRRASLCSA